MPINTIDPTRDPFYLSQPIDAVLKSLSEQNMAFVMTVQSQDQELSISHYSTPTETYSATCRAMCKLEAAW